MNTRRKAGVAILDRSSLVASGWLAAVLCGFVGPLKASSGDEVLDRPDGPQHVEGRIEADGRGGFGFAVKGQGKRVELEAGSSVTFAGGQADAVAAPPPFQFVVGQSLRVSGSLREISPEKVRFSVLWQPGEITLPRACLQSAVQRPGEARVLVEGFESLDPVRWTIIGKPEVVEEPHLLDRRSLRIPAGGTTLSYRLEEPLARGRVDIAFHDSGKVVPGRQWYLEFAFRGSTAVRVNLGWSEETLAVASSPSGPSLAVQRLARRPGWHRLSLRFGPSQTEVSVDGKELANGRETDGPLTGIRLISSDSAAGSTATDLAGYVDDLQIVRLVEPPASHESDFTQDEARLVVGDQLFGEVTKADIQGVAMKVDGQPISLSWGEVSGLYFRRRALQAKPIEGLLARVEWRAAAGEDAADLDYAEGALTGLTDKTLTFQTPYAGTLTIPRNQVRRLKVLGTGQRVVIDATSHHLGDELSTIPPLLDPVEPEGGTLERSFDLGQVPKAGGFVVLNVLEVVNENSEPNYWQQVRDGYLRTFVWLNGQRIDYINHYVKTSNKTPESIKIPIPAGLARAGKNTLRIELTGTETNPNWFDDLGILEMSVEFPMSGVPTTPLPHIQP
jgi:hypothetical protein